MSENNNTGWVALEEELDAWRAAGRTATLWWRDDDAVMPTDALDDLLYLAESFDIAVGLAVIPAHAVATLASRLAQTRHACVLQHGYAHTNYGAIGEKATELGAHRSAGTVLEELATGWGRLEALFDGPLPVLVPPWNRISAALFADLSASGYRALSTFAPRADEWVANGLAVVNCHVDFIYWKGGRGFLGTEKTVGQLVEHLRARRLGDVDSHEPSGILTHHLVHDAACRGFLSALFERTREHPAVRWLHPRQALLSS